MQTFHVTAIPVAGGRPFNDVVRHDSERDVRAKFGKDGFIITQLDHVEPSGAAVTAKHASLKATFYREMALHLENAIPAKQIADGLKRTFAATDPRFRARIRKVLDAIASEQPIFRALESEPALFGHDEIALVELAYKRGKTPDVLANLADQLERDSDVNGKTSRALWYPAVLTVVALVVLAIYAGVMLPQLRQFYATLQIPLIFPLDWMVAAYDFFAQPMHGIILGSIVAATIVAFVAVYRSSDEFRYRLDYAKMQMPVFGKLISKKRLARVLFALDLMVSSGEQFRALDAAYGVCDGPVFRRNLARAKAKVDTKEVRVWTEALEAAPDVFDPLLVGLLATGERYGVLQDKIRAAIEATRKQIDAEIEQLPRKLESTLAIVFSFIIGFLVYAMVVPTSYATAHIH
jgi:type II secretory pathway component PulF